MQKTLYRQILRGTGRLYSRPLNGPYHVNELLYTLGKPIMDLPLRLETPPGRSRKSKVTRAKPVGEEVTTVAAATPNTAPPAESSPPAKDRSCNLWFSPHRQLILGPLRDRFKAKTADSKQLTERLSEGFWLLKRLKQYEDGHCVRPDPFSFQTESPHLSNLYKDKLPMVESFTGGKNQKEVPHLSEQDDVPAVGPADSPMEFSLTATGLSESLESFPAVPTGKSRLYVSVNGTFNPKLGKTVTVLGYSLYSVNPHTTEFVQLYHATPEDRNVLRGMLVDPVEEKDKEQAKPKPSNTTAEKGTPSNAFADAPEESPVELTFGDTPSSAQVQWNDYLVVPVEAPAFIKGFIYYSVAPVPPSTWLSERKKPAATEKATVYAAEIPLSWVLKEDSPL